jgi:hypothetical protein
MLSGRQSVKGLADNEEGARAVCTVPPGPWPIPVAETQFDAQAAHHGIVEAQGALEITNAEKDMRKHACSRGDTAIASTTRCQPGPEVAQARGQIPGGPSECRRMIVGESVGHVERLELAAYCQTRAAQRGTRSSNGNVGWFVVSDMILLRTGFEVMLLEYPFAGSFHLRTSQVPAMS